MQSITFKSNWRYRFAISLEISFSVISYESIISES